MQSRNKDADIENKWTDTKEGKEGGTMNWETGADTCTLWVLRVKQITNEDHMHTVGFTYEADHEWEPHAHYRCYVWSRSRMRTTCTLWVLRMKQITNENHMHTIGVTCEADLEWEPTAEHRELYSAFPGGLNGKRIRKRGGICTRVADSLCSTAETNSTLWSSYTSTKTGFFGNGKYN